MSFNPKCVSCRKHRVVSFLIHSVNLSLIFIYFFNPHWRVYLLILKREGRERERGKHWCERNIDSSPPVCTLTRDWTHNFWCTRWPSNQASHPTRAQSLTEPAPAWPWVLSAPAAHLRPSYRSGWISSLSPWLSDFHTVQFSVSSGCFFVFKLLLSFFCLCEGAQGVYLCLHLGRKSDWNFLKFHLQFIIANQARFPCYLFFVFHVLAPLLFHH